MASHEALSVTGPRPFPWGRCLKDAALMGMLVMLAFSPITNLVLNQYDFHFLPWRVPVIVNGFALAILVMLGRLVFQLYFHSGRAAAIGQAGDVAPRSPVHVFLPGAC